MPRSWEIHFEPAIDTRDVELLEEIVWIESCRLSIPRIPLPPRFQEKINSLNIVRQIRGTTGIEGNTIEEDRIKSILTNTDEEGEDKSVDTKERKTEEQEIVNANKVLMFIRKDVTKNPDAIITSDLIKKLHEITTSGCNYLLNTPGRYRNVNVAVGDYSPPDYQEVESYMDKFIEFINSRRVCQQYNSVIRAVLAHFYLISIHPFGDGNGRTSRGLEAYILFHGKYNVRGFYSLANFYYKNRAAYIDKLQEARFRYNGDLNDFVKFSLRGYRSELEEIQSEVLFFVKTLTFKDFIKELSGDKEINRRQSVILDQLSEVDLSASAIHLPSINLHKFLSKADPFARAIYSELTEKTMHRDITQLRKMKLIVIADGVVRANLDVMDEFM